MNTKSMFKITLLMLSGGIFGALFAAGLLIFDTANSLSSLEAYLKNKNMHLFILLIVTLFLPSVYLFLRSKKDYNKINEMSDDEYEVKVKDADRRLNIGLILNSTFMICNFLVFGATFDRTANNIFLITIIFLMNVIAVTIFEINVVRFIQRLDNRLKGDPATFKFTKVFVESCDEAEKLKIYKSGYHALQASKLTSLGFVSITIICNIVLDTGALPVIISCTWMLVNTISYGFYAIKPNFG